MTDEINSDNIHGIGSLVDVANAKVRTIRRERDAAVKELCLLAGQVINDIDAIEKELWHGKYAFADWSTPAHTRDYCRKILARLEPKKEAP